MTGLCIPSVSHSRRRSSAQVRMFQDPALLRSLRPWPRRSKYRTWKSPASGSSADFTVMWSRPGPPWTATRTGRSAVVSPCGMTDGPETSNHRDTSPRLMRTRPPGRLRRAGSEAHSNLQDAAHARFVTMTAASDAQLRPALQLRPLTQSGRTRTAITERYPEYRSGLSLTLQQPRRELFN